MEEGAKMSKIQPDFGQIWTLIANISGTVKDTDNRKKIAAKYNFSRLWRVF